MSCGLAGMTPARQRWFVQFRLTSRFPTTTLSSYSLFAWGRQIIYR